MTELEIGFAPNCIELSFSARLAAAAAEGGGGMDFALGRSPEVVKIYSY